MPFHSSSSTHRSLADAFAPDEQFIIPGVASPVDAPDAFAFAQALAAESPPDALTDDCDSRSSVCSDDSDDIPDGVDPGVFPPELEHWHATSRIRDSVVEVACAPTAHAAAPLAERENDRLLSLTLALAQLMGPSSNRLSPAERDALHQQVDEHRDEFHVPADIGNLAPAALPPMMVTFGERSTDAGSHCSPLSSAVSHHGDGSWVLLRDVPVPMDVVEAAGSACGACGGQIEELARVLASCGCTHHEHCLADALARTPHCPGCGDFAGVE